MAGAFASGPTETTFQSSTFAGIAASLGVLLGAVYMLTLCRKILFGPLDNDENKDLKDLNAREFGYLIPLSILAIVMGVAPNLFLDKIRPSIEHLANNYKSYRLVDVSHHDATDQQVAGEGH